MKFICVIFGLCLYTPVTNAKMLKVAVIDTGIDFTVLDKVPLCKDGHKSFTKDNTLKDRNDIQHGTNIVGLIAKYSDNSNYCIIIIKFYDKQQNSFALGKAISYAATLDVDIVNISAGGAGFDDNEKVGIERLLTKNVIVVSAAGNDKQNLDYSCYFYPACYDKRIIVVGATNVWQANTGSIIDVKESGYKEVGTFGRPLSGTSQATAIYTGKLIKRLSSK